MGPNYGLRWKWLSLSWKRPAQPIVWPKKRTSRANGQRSYRKSSRFWFRHDRRRWIRKINPTFYKNNCYDASLWKVLNEHQSKLSIDTFKAIRLCTLRDWSTFSNHWMVEDCFYLDINKNSSHEHVRDGCVPDVSYSIVLFCKRKG